MIKFDFSDLIKNMPIIESMIEREEIALAAKVTIDVHRNVVLGSPVDTGAFRAAWTVETPTRPFENGKVENNTAYGPALVHGHSTQAPNGWIDNAIEAATRL